MNVHSPLRDAPQPLAPDELERMDAWWRAANYLSVGLVYLLDNPMLREPLAMAHVKPRLLGHFGTTPGLNFIYLHLKPVIKARDDLSVLFVAGPGHGAPGVVASTYLDGTYSELYSEVSRDDDGMRRLWCDRHDPSVFRPSTNFGPVHPLGLRMTIIGQRGRPAPLPDRAASWMARISAIASSKAAAIAWCMIAGSSPSTKIGACP